MLAQQRRLVKEKDFSKTFRQGRSFYGKFLGVKANINELSSNRYGIVISTKVSKKAVERNKLKRQIRSLLKEFDKHLHFGYNFIIIVLPAALNQEFKVLHTELEKIFSQLRLFKQRK